MANTGQREPSKITGIGLAVTDGMGKPVKLLGLQRVNSP